MVAGEVRAPTCRSATTGSTGGMRTRWRWPRSSGTRRSRPGKLGATAGEFFIGEHPARQTGLAVPAPVPAAITEALRRMLPEDVQRQIGVETDAWAESCVRCSSCAHGAGRGCRRLRGAEAAGHGRAELARPAIRADNQHADAAAAHRAACQPERLPKYGFPTDTVELRTAYSGDPVDGSWSYHAICRRHLRVRARRRGGCGREAVDVTRCVSAPGTGAAG